MITPIGYNGEIGFVTFVDDYSRLARIYCIKSTSDLINKFMHYVNTTSNLMNCNLKVLWCDRGTEYFNKCFDEFYSGRGILIKPSPAYIHELNIQQKGTIEQL